MGLAANGLYSTVQYRHINKDDEQGSLEMVSISKPGESLYKLLIWGLAASGGLAIWMLQDMSKTQKEVIEGIHAMRVEVATLKAKSDGIPEKIVDLYAKLATLELAVAKNTVRLEDIRK